MGSIEVPDDQGRKAILGTFKVFHNGVMTAKLIAQFLLQSSPLIDFDFNITHDGDWVAIAFQETFKQLSDTPAPIVGIDVMEIHLPPFESSVLDFVDTMDMTLTSLERQWILSDYTQDIFVTQDACPDDLSRQEYDQLKKLYILWTYKEAFTKAKGLGLGYDFQTIEIIKEADKVSVTAAGKPEKGLKIRQMILPPGRSAARKTGGGTGLSSLLVVFQLTEDEAIEMKEIDIETAQYEKLLRLWTMEDLVEASKSAMGQG
jgi:phosphopantetheine--protein transferase-like protein